MAYYYEANICTICLIESAEVNNISQNNDIITKITECFGKDIIIILPTICKLCVEKIEEVSSFRNLIIRNQNILSNRLKNKSDIDIKPEKDTEVEKKENDYKIIKIEPIEYECTFTNEPEISEEGTDSDAEDNLSLSLIKKSNENINNNEKKPIKSESPSKEITDNANRCVTCFQTHSTQTELLKHYNTEHNKPKENNKKDINYETVTVDNSVKYKCTKCDKLFISKVKINKHMICHVEERPFVCKLCGRTYKQASEIVRHGKIHNDLPVHCKFRCGFSTAYKKGLRQHERRHNNENAKPIKSESPSKEITDNANRCVTCFQTHSTQTELLKHYNTEHNKPRENNKKDINYETVTVDNNVKYKCTKCDKLFLNKVKINKHMICHVEERPFVCKLCGRTYKQASEIVRHGKIHNDLPVHCKFRCGFSTTYKKGLRQHERRHNKEYEYTCEKCGKGFDILSWYEQHQNKHTGDKPFVCNICGVAFHMDRYLQAHIRSIHPESCVGERFICVHCSKPCGSKKSLTLHLKEHGITSKFLCDLCGKVFSLAPLLKQHKRYHLGIRPHSCTICNKSFAKLYNMKVHMRTHSRERTHACLHCGKLFARRCTLLAHMQRFHK